MVNIKLLFSVFALAVLFGCMQEDAGATEREVLGKVNHNYTVQNEYNLVSCYFNMDGYRKVFFHILSTDNSTISMAIFNENKMGMEVSKDKPGMIGITNAEIAADQEGFEYFFEFQFQSR